MGRGKKAKNAKESLFRGNGVKPDIFNQILPICKKEFNEMHKSGGKPLKLTPEDKLYVTLKYKATSTVLKRTGKSIIRAKNATHWKARPPRDCTRVR
jgi:hypothetical protein